MLLHDAVADAEAKPGAFAHGLGGEKRVKDLAREFYSRPGIGKLDDHFRVLALGANHELAAADFVERVHCIADQVEEYLQQLVGIAAHRRQFGFGEGLDIDVRPAQVEIAQVQSGRQHLIYILRDLLAGNAPCEAEQASDQSLDAPRERANLFRHLALAVAELAIIHQQVGIAQNPGQRIVDFMRGSGGKLSQRNQLFGLNHLGLDAFQVFQRFVRGPEQPAAIVIHELLAEENQERAHDDGHLRDANAEIPHQRRVGTLPKRPQSHQRNGEDRGHGEIGRPAFELSGVRGNRLARWSQAMRDKPGGAEPHETCHQRQVKGAAGVVFLAVDSAVGDVRTRGIEQRGAEKMRVHLAPGAFRARHQHREPYDQHHVFSRGQVIVTQAVGQNVGGEVLPGNDHEQVEVNPPDQKQREVHIAGMDVEVVTLIVGLQRQRADHGNWVQEQNHVTDKRVGNGLAQNDFKVGPDRLAHQPPGTAEAQKQPEEARTALGGGGVHQQADAGEQGRQALEDIAKGGEASAGRNRKRHNGIAANKDHPAPQQDRLDAEQAGQSAGERPREKDLLLHGFGAVRTAASFEDTTAWAAGRTGFQGDVP